MSRDAVAAATRWWLGRLTQRALAGVLAVLALAGASLLYAIAELGFDTDTANLLDPDVPFRQAFSRYTEHFPQYHDTLVAVVEAPAPELAHLTAGQLADALRRHDETFPLVYRPRGDPFLERNALLYLDTDQLARLGDRLAAAQPLLARLAARPALDGYFDLLTEILERRGMGRDDLATIFDATARAVDPGSGPGTVISWQSLMRGENAVLDQPARALVVAAPRMDYERIMAGRAPMEKLRTTIQQLPIADADTRIRVTGKVALQHEELLSALGGAKRAGIAALVLVALLLYVAIRSWRLLAVALVTLAAGMCLSAGAAALAVGHLNLISIAFAVLYVGLGINYALHYLVRYREALADGIQPRQAVIVAGQRLSGALLLCTITTAIGFFAFLPTDFAGVAELGLIAGLAMFITLLVTYTLLPGLLTLLPAPDGTRFSAGPPLPGSWLDWPARHRLAVRWIALTLAVLALVLAPQVRFDEDPLNLRDPESESVATALDLLKEGGDVQRNLVVLTEDRQKLETLARRLESLDTVRTTIDLTDLVPTDQAEKLQQIRDLAFVLGPGIVERPFALRADPEPEPVIRAAAALRDVLVTRDAEPASRQLAAALDRWLAHVNTMEDPTPAVRSLQETLLGTLPTAVSRLQTALRGADMFSAEDLPQALHRRYRSPDGWHLLQVLPADDLNDPLAQRRFVESVQTIAPQVTGVPVLQVESGEAIVTAFRTALGSAVAGIILVLLFLLRSIGTTIRVLIPLLLGGLLTVAAMVMLGLPFNFANVIALPLLLGVGVDNGIHMVSRQQESAANDALHTSTARAILFGALATVASFGNLALSPHLGTATMGMVLALGMVLILATTFLVLPALLGRTAGPAAGSEA